MHHIVDKNQIINSMNLAELFELNQKYYHSGIGNWRSPETVERYVEDYFREHFDANDVIEDYLAERLDRDLYRELRKSFSDIYESFMQGLIYEYDHPFGDFRIEMELNFIEYLRPFRLIEIFEKYRFMIVAELKKIELENIEDEKKRIYDQEMRRRKEEQLNRLFPKSFRIFIECFQERFGFIPNEYINPKRLRFEKNQRYWSKVKEVLEALPPENRQAIIHSASLSNSVSDEFGV
jgi:hypothetical protein